MKLKSSFRHYISYFSKYWIQVSRNSFFLRPGNLARSRRLDGFGAYKVLDPVSGQKFWKIWEARVNPDRNRRKVSRQESRNLDFLGPSLDWDYQGS